MPGNRCLTLLLTLGLGCLSIQTAAATDPDLQPFTAQYQVIRNNIPLGNLVLQLELDPDGEYRYSGLTQPSAVIGWFVSDSVFEQSRGLYRNRRIIPHAYEYRQSQTEPFEKRTRLEFDWEAEKVWTQSEGIRWSQTLKPGTHDKYSQQLALRLELSAGNQSVSYPVADGGRIKTYHYQVVDNETITIPYGRLACLKVRRSKQNRSPDYTIWFAPELDFLPVKIAHDRASGSYSMELTEFNDDG
jgi:hypothetical protein